MDLYTTIVGLYSQNRHEVLRVVNTAIHSKCNLSEGIEVIHTGFYCFTHTGKELEFLYDTQSQILYFQGSNSNGYHFPLGVLFQSKCLPHIINYQGSVRMRFSLMLNNNSFFSPSLKKEAFNIEPFSSVLYVIVISLIRFSLSISMQLAKLSKKSFS